MADSPTDIEVTLLLCDAAQSIGGKLYILGGGWSHIMVPPGAPVPMSLAIKFAIPWDRGNHPIGFTVALKNEDGEFVHADDGPIELKTEFEVGRPPGIEPGTPLDAIFALNGPALPLDTGKYVWELEVDGKKSARAPFRVQVQGN